MIKGWDFKRASDGEKTPLGAAAKGKGVSPMPNQSAIRQVKDPERKQQPPEEENKITLPLPGLGPQ